MGTLWPLPFKTKNSSHRRKWPTGHCYLPRQQSTSMGKCGHGVNHVEGALAHPQTSTTACYPHLRCDACKIAVEALQVRSLHTHVTLCTQGRGIKGAWGMSSQRRTPGECLEPTPQGLLLFSLTCSGASENHRIWVLCEHFKAAQRVQTAVADLPVQPAHATCLNSRPTAPALLAVLSMWR